MRVNQVWKSGNPSGQCHVCGAENGQQYGVNYTVVSGVRDYDRFFEANMVKNYSFTELRKLQQEVSSGKKEAFICQACFDERINGLNMWYFVEGSKIALRKKSK